MKHHLNQRGSLPIIIVLVVIVLVGVGFAGYRVMNAEESPETNQSNTQNTPNESGVSSTDPETLELQNLGLDSFDSVLVTTQATREFGSNGFKGFYAFGDKLGGGGATRQNPNLEYSSLKDTAKVVAAVDGVIVHIQEQTDSSDQEVFLSPSDKSVWIIGYDHLLNLQVSKGDSVKAGDYLGDPAPQNNGQLRFEIQVNKEENGSTTHYCPSLLLSDQVKDSQLAGLKTMMMKWETETGLELYDIDSQKPVGCIKQMLTPAEAEGR